MRCSIHFVVLLVWLAAMVVRGQTVGSATMNIQIHQPGAVVSSNLFGIFFEEINFAGDGGLYAERVRDRSFHNPANPDYWSLVTSGSAVGTMSVDPGQPLNTNVPNSLKLIMAAGGGGFHHNVFHQPGFRRLVSAHFRRASNHWKSMAGRAARFRKHAILPPGGVTQNLVLSLSL